MALQELVVMEHDYKTLVLDTLNGAERLCHEWVCEHQCNNRWEDFDAYGRGPKMALAKIIEFTQVIDRLRDKGMTAIRTSCGWQTARNIHSDGLRSFLKGLGEKAPRTINSYRDALVTFCNWCIGEDVFEENPVAHVKKARSPGGQKYRPRRAYNVEEFRRLCENTLNHRLVYLVAGLSGLRKSELRQLEKRDFTPVGEAPTWHLRPEIAKGRRKDVVPMLPECAALIAPIWSALTAPTQRVFKRMPRTQTLHKDLQRASIVRIDGEGRHVDFHSLRYFFCTILARRLPIQFVRLLMRHKNIRETCDLYMDLGLSDLNEALVKVPALVPAAALGEQVATGGDQEEE
jgi:integrase